MRYFLLIILTATLGGVYYYYTTQTQPVDSRAALDSAVQTAKQSKPLSAGEEQVLRLQLALVDYLTLKGHPPDNLNELVPTYFDVVPKDPTTNKPFDYVREGRGYRLGGLSAGPKQSVASAAKSDGGKQDKEGVVAVSAPEEVFVYDPTGKRDPFIPFDFSSKPRDGANTPLERYALSQLRLTAVLSDAKGGAKAIVEDMTGKGFSVGMGARIGDKNGVVVAIEQDRLMILETQEDFTGKMVQNVVEMKIQTQPGGSAKAGAAQRRR